MASSREYQMLFQLSASLGGGFSSTFSTGQKAVGQLQQQINALNRTQADISAYQKQQAALDKSKDKLALYQHQLERLRGVEAGSASEAAHLANEIEAKEQQVNNAQNAVDKNNAKLSEMGNALRQAGVDTNNLTAESERLAAESANVAREQLREAEAAQEAGSSFGDAMQGIQAGLEAIGAAQGLKALFNALKDASQQAAEFETAMASVKRTVGGSDDFIAGLGESFKDLSTQMPITASELASIASTAGQLGIAQENVEQFTTVMAQLATTTDLTADNAATMLAQFANITGTTDYERLGSTVAALGDATATTASKVVEMSQGMAAAASLAGMSETDILAISAAVGSLGIEAQAGSTAMSQLITTLYKAVETGDGLQDFASVAGMSASDFASAWSGEPVSAMNAFIQGLNNTEQNGKSAIAILDELGITNVRQTKAILGLASAGDLLSSTIEQANGAWSSNSALAQKAGVMYDTTGARMTMLQNAANNVTIAIGDALNPAVSGVAGALTGLMNPIADFIEANPAIVQAVTTFAGVLGVAVTGISAYTAATKLAAAASKLLGTSLSGYLGPVLAIAGGLGALVGIISAVTGANREAGKSFEELQAEYESLQDTLEDNQHVIDLVDQYQKLTKEVEKIGKLDDADVTLKATLETSGLTEDDLKMVDELKKRIDTKTGEIKQILTISGADDISDDDLKTITDLAAAATDGDHELKQQLALVGAGDITDEDLATLKELSGAVKDDQATLSQTLSLSGFENYEDMKKAAELPISSKTAQILVDMQATGYKDVQEKLQQLGADVLAAQSAVSSAKNDLTNMQTQAQKLQETIDGTRNNKQKSALQKELDDLNEQIGQQEDKVGDLQKAHDALAEEYNTVATASSELKAKEDELAGTKAALAGLVDGVAGASETETEALLDQAKAANELNKALTMTAIYTNLSQQAKTYSEAVRSADNATSGYNTTMQRIQIAQQYAGMQTEEINAAYQGLLATLNQMQQAEGFDPTNVDYLNTIDQVQTLATLFQGFEYDESFREYAGDMLDWVSAFGYLSTGEATWTEALASMSDSLVSYQGEIDAATAKQQSFLDLLANGVISGAVKIDEIRTRLENAFSGEVNSEELLAAAMEYITTKVQEQTEATEAAAQAEKELAEATGELSDANEDHARTVDDIITDVENLRKAYEDAYDAAYDSMEGQFDLFEKVNKVSGKGSKLNKGKDSYVAGLQSQAEYMDQYASNYQKAAEALRAAEDRIYGEGASHEGSSSLLSQLADGSEESAQVIADIAAASGEDVESLVTEYDAAQKAKDEYAKTLAEVQTDFTNTMATLESELQSTVQAMDFSADAAANAKASLDAFIAAANGYVGKAFAAYRKVGAAAARGLAFNPTIQPHAAGTDSADPGFALVGEEGPELVFLQGGEKILNASETQQALTARAITAEPSGGTTTQAGAGGNNYQVTVSIPSINASGMDPEELKNMIADSLGDAIESKLQEIEEDEDRRNYV